MVKLDKEELAKLSPTQRIKRLKEIEEDSKKDIAEAEDLIRRSESEIETAESEKKIAVPESRKVDISDLFGPEPSQLEAKAKEAKKEPSQQQLLYMANQAYEEATSLAYREATPELLEQIDELGEKVDKMQYHSLTEEITNKVVATRSLIHKIKRYSQMDHKW